MRPDDADRWMDGYLTAWRTNDPQDILALFTPDARYYTAPYREPWTGHDAIVQGWIGRDDEFGTWEFRYEVLAVAGDLAFVRGWTSYGRGERYDNLWVIRLTEDGRASEFIEWWMDQSTSET